MKDPSGPLKILKTNWKVGDPFGKLRVALRDSKGDQREVPAPALAALHATDAYDSYQQLYRIDGLHWRVEGQISRPDGQTICLLRCVNE